MTGSTTSGWSDRLAAASTSAVPLLFVPSPKTSDARCAASAPAHRATAQSAPNARAHSPVTSARAAARKSQSGAAITRGRATAALA